MEAAAALDAMLVMESIDTDEHERGISLLTELVAMLTPLSGIRKGAS